MSRSQHMEEREGVGRDSRALSPEHEDCLKVPDGVQKLMEASVINPTRHTTLGRATKTVPARHGYRMVAPCRAPNTPMEQVT